MNALTFRLLEVFKQIVESGSITAASVALQLSQPTVSLQLKKLTEICGVTLLETHHGTVLLTDAGNAVYQCANDIMRSKLNLSAHIESLKAHHHGGFKLAVVIIAKYLIPPILKPFDRHCTTRIQWPKSLSPERFTTSEIFGARTRFGNASSARQILSATPN